MHSKNTVKSSCTLNTSLDPHSSAFMAVVLSAINTTDPVPLVAMMAWCCRSGAAPFRFFPQAIFKECKTFLVTLADNDINQLLASKERGHAEHSRPHDKIVFKGD